MLKATLFSVFTSTAILLGAFFADGVVIDHNTPDSLNPGEKKIVSICINKGEVTGFAKLQLEIPAGLTVRHIKKSGASFTFSGQKAKFIWMTLPDSQNFCVEYEIEANATACGPMAITGQFSYIKDNERIDYGVDTKTIQVGDCGGSGTPVAGNVNDNVPEENPQPSSSASSNVSCIRTVTEISAGEFLVELECEGAETDGFAKYIENIPSDYVINEDNNGTAITTVNDNQIKFVWFEKPSDSSFSVSYKLTGPSFKDPKITGDFSFVNNNTPVDTRITNKYIPHPDADNMANDQNQSNSNSSEKQDSNPPEEEGSAMTDDDTANSKSDDSSSSSNTDDAQAMNNSNDLDNSSSGTSEVADNSASNVPDAEEGVTYKVQLAASHKYVSGDKFKASHKFNGKIQLENHEGWTKYTTGSHGEYKSARDARNTLTASYPDFKGPFVTAYNYGQRITVQEALMISKQKWYQ